MFMATPALFGEYNKVVRDWIIFQIMRAGLAFILFVIVLLHTLDRLGI